MQQIIQDLDSTWTMDGLTISHDPGTLRFSAMLDGIEVGYLTYTLVEKTMDIEHTVVKPEMRGKGIGSRLVDAACDHAVSSGYTLLTSCSFAAKPPTR
jgi:predicted GNAT family acetyltransferase